MKSDELYLEKFKREITFRPAFDRRHGDPAKNYGIHGMEMRFVLRGPDGATQFLFYTGIHLAHVADELATKELRYRGWMGADVGYHSPKQMYEGQKPMGKCDILEGKVCYYDGSSLAAEELAVKFVAEGEDAVWTLLAERYADWFENAK